MKCIKKCSILNIKKKDCYLKNENVFTCADLND